MKPGLSKDISILILVATIFVGFSMQDPPKKEQSRMVKADSSGIARKDTLVAVASLIENAKAEIQQFQQQIGTLQSEISVRVGRIQGWQIIAKDSVWVEKGIFGK